MPPLRYRESPPPPDLASLVVCWWEFAVAPDLPQPADHEVFPDGCTAVVHLRNRRASLSWLRVLGPRLRALRTPLRPGDVFWGIRLQPAATAAVLGSAAALRDANLDCHQVNPALSARLKVGLARSRSFEEAVVVFTSVLRALPIGPIDQEVAEAVRRIVASRGEARMEDVARHGELSARQLQRRFRAATGLTPKQLARARRLRATVEALLQAGDQTSWAALAAEGGFTDQAHLTHELVKITGRTPAGFAERLRRIRHGKLVP